MPTDWWPKFLYHFAELKNVVSILEQGTLLCRDAKAMKVDTASAKIMGHTDAEWTKFVRFYFRPRTPTQHQCEGFRPLNQYDTLGAHCPMPFVFMFNAAEILTRSDTKFSDGNLSGHPAVGDSAEFFCSLPFEGIYHASPLAPDVKAKIINQRCAEVLVPTSLDLGSLNRIWCRSPAEYQTLLSRLSSQTRLRYQTKIGHGAQLETHFRKWTYVESATLEHNRITLRFNPSSQTPGPFIARMTIDSPQYGAWEWTNDAFHSSAQPLILNLPAFEADANYEMLLTLDGNEAYFGHYRPEPNGPVILV